MVDAKISQLPAYATPQSSDVLPIVDVSLGITKKITYANLLATLLTNPMTTAGDVIYGGASGIPTRLANGSSGQVLTSNGGTAAPSWQTPGGGGGGANVALSNLSGVAINTSLLLGTSDGGALGSTTKMWSDIFLAAGAVINFNNGDVTITHSTNQLTFAGASTGYFFDSLVAPVSNDGGALGSTTNQWSDVYIAEGGVINWDNGDATLTQSGNTVTLAGANLAVPTGTSGGIQVGDANFLTEQTALDFIDWQRVGADYTLMRIKAPTGTNNTHEATLSLLIDRDGNNTGVNEEFIDFYNEHYVDSIRGGIRLVNTGTGSLKPFIIGHWNTVGPKDDGDGLIIFAYDAVGVVNSLNVGITVLTATTAYSRFGTGTTGHGLSVSRDVLVGGILEVDGVAFFDSTVQAATIMAIGGTASAGTALLLNGTGYANNLFAATGSVSPAAGTNGTLYRLAGTIVEAGSGTHNLLSGFFLGATTVTAGAATVANTASLYIEGPMVATVTGINYAVWIDDGEVRIDGDIGDTSHRVTKGWFTDLEVTNAPTLGGVAIPSISSTDTLTNKRITPRTVTITNGTTYTPTGDTADMNNQVNTQGAGTLTMNAPTGTPTSGQQLWIRLSSTSVQTFSWNAIYRGGTTVALPTASTGSGKTDYFLFKYNSTDSKWDIQVANYGYT